MPAFKWSDDYSVNIAEMDEQHKKLVTMLNKLDDSYKQGNSEDILGQVLYELLDYVKQHFAAEEKLMQENDYPDYFNHRQAHIALTVKTAELKSRHDNMRPTDTLNVITFLTEWLMRHIMGVDKRYSAFLNSRGVF